MARGAGPGSLASPCRQTRFNCFAERLRRVRRLKKVGITAFGAYVPRLRLQRAAVLDAVAWFNDGLRSLGKGERAIAGWDEDVITLALEAARDCLIDVNRDRVSRVTLASTSLPFADRQNAGVVKEALNLSD